MYGSNFPIVRRKEWLCRSPSRWGHDLPTALKPAGRKFPDAEVRVLPPQPASLCASISECRSNGAVSRRFTDMAFSPCAEFGNGSAIPVSCLRGLLFGVSFLSVLRNHHQAGVAPPFRDTRWVQYEKHRDSRWFAIQLSPFLPRGRVLDSFFYLPHINKRLVLIYRV
jgi:hypothetical protein